MSAYPDDEVTALVAGVLNDSRTPRDPKGRARAVRDILAAARMLNSNAYPRIVEVRDPEPLDCDRDPDCVLGDAHGGACRNRAEEEEWQAH